MREAVIDESGHSISMKIPNPMHLFFHNLFLGAVHLYKSAPLHLQFALSNRSSYHNRSLLLMIICLILHLDPVRCSVLSMNPILCSGWLFPEYLHQGLAVPRWGQNQVHPSGLWYIAVTTSKE